MVRQRVFIIWSHELFYESVHILLDHPDIEEVGASAKSSSTHSEIEKLRPDIILVEEATETSRTEVLQMLEDCVWNPRIISLSLQDNELMVYHREQRTIEQVDDLLFLIQDE
jgi:DNA-binding NarL/FixJ family response regulator